MVIQAGIQVGIYFLPVGVFIALVIAAAIVLLLAMSLVVQLAVLSQQSPAEDDELVASTFFAELGESA